MSKLFVEKFNKEKELFSIKKVFRSVKKSGGSNDLAKKISNIIKNNIYSGIKTSAIENQVSRLLKKENPKIATKFSLKRGLKRLGPSGFPFEKYIKEIFDNYGYRTKINQFITGKCCTYEIDFLAEKDGILYIGECKYRNLIGGKVHSKDALANYARFLDISNGKFAKGKKLKSILVTNTRFTSKAEKYCQCVDVDVLGWKTPSSKGLEYLIEAKKLYPITILSSLNNRVMDILVHKKMMLVQDLLDKDIAKLAKITKLSKRDLLPLIKEAKILLT